MKIIDKILLVEIYIFEQNDNLFINSELMWLWLNKLHCATFMVGWYWYQLHSSAFDVNIIRDAIIFF